MERRTRIDIHVHSEFSTDSQAKMDDVVRTAIDKGIQVLCFTDHIDWDYPVEDLAFDFDVSVYQKNIEAMRSRYGDRIRILMGVELGMQEHLAGRYRRLLADYPFDFAIGSQHLVGGMDPYYPETFAGKTDAEVYRQYFEDLLADVKAFHDFDSLGHLDYVVRYGRTRAREYSYRKYADLIDEVLKLLIRYNKALEINTCGLRKQLGFPNPHPDILRRYRQMGGTLVTIGSDAHRPELLGDRFDQAVGLLRQCGFSHYCYYVKHEPVFVMI